MGDVASYKPLVMPDANDPLAHLRAGDTVADTYLMPPPNLHRRVAETPPPTDYKVPSFLRQAKAKANQMICAARFGHGAINREVQWCWTDHWAVCREGKK